MRKRLGEVEAERKRERVSASNMHRFQSSQICDLQGSATQAKPERTTPGPESTTTSRGGNPERATGRNFRPDSDGTEEPLGSCTGAAPCESLCHGVPKVRHPKL
jgi:hypothetical protein